MMNSILLEPSLLGMTLRLPGSVSFHVNDIHPSKRNKLNFMKQCSLLNAMLNGAISDLMVSLRQCAACSISSGAECDLIQGV